jgi:circadian clock protein KaiC
MSLKKKKVNKIAVRNNNSEAIKESHDKDVPKKHSLSSLIKGSISKITGRKRIPTGIINFDGLVQGGFDKNSTNLIVGDSGAGKSIFATQFLMEGIKRGEKCLYITFEEEKEEFYENMAAFGWDLKKYEQSGDFVFLEYAPEKVRTMLEEGGGIIENIVLKKKIARVVIDSITSFELLFDSDIEKREASLSLFNLLRKWNCTSLLTYEADTFREKSSSSTVEFESDSIILLYFVRSKKERKRYIEVMKMRGTNHSRNIYPASIEKNGIVIGKEPFLGELRPSN